MCVKHLHLTDNTFHIFGSKLSILNGALSLDYEKPRKTFPFHSRTLLSSFYKVKHILLDEPLDVLKHFIRDSYRQCLLQQASKRRQDCYGKIRPIDIGLTRDYYFSLRQPLHQTLLRQILTGAIDHRNRLHKSNLTDSPLCLFCNHDTETAKHIFWDCPQWSFIRTNYPVLLRLYTLVGTQWPSCYLNCGWIERERNYGFMLLDDVLYDHRTFITQTHQMFLHILLARHEATQVFISTPITPPNIHSPESISSSPNRTPTNVQIRADVSPISICSSEQDSNVPSLILLPSAKKNISIHLKEVTGVG